MEETYPIAVAVLYVLGMMRGAGMVEDVALLEHALAVYKVGELSDNEREIAHHAERIGAGGTQPPEDAFWEVRHALDRMDLSAPLVMGIAKGLIEGLASRRRERGKPRILH